MNAGSHFAKKIYIYKNLPSTVMGGNAGLEGVELVMRDHATREIEEGNDAGYRNSGQRS